MAFGCQSTVLLTSGRTEAVWKELLIQKKEGCEDGRSEEVWRTLYSDIVERVLYEGGGYQSTRG